MQTLKSQYTHLVLDGSVCSGIEKQTRADVTTCLSGTTQRSHATLDVINDTQYRNTIKIDPSNKYYESTDGNKCLHKIKRKPDKWQFPNNFVNSRTDSTYAYALIARKNSNETNRVFGVRISPALQKQTHAISVPMRGSPTQRGNSDLRFELVEPSAQYMARS